MNTMTMYGPAGTGATDAQTVRLVMDVLRDNGRLLYVEVRHGRRCNDVNVFCDCLVCNHHRDGMLVVDFTGDDGIVQTFRVGGAGPQGNMFADFEAQFPVSRAVVA